MRKRILTTAIAAAIGVTSYTANAISLGAINQKSHLNQNYYATIDLSSIKNSQVYKVKAKLASPEIFKNANLERFYHLTKLKFKSQIINGKPAIVITSKDPIRQPYLNFLVEANWPEGRMIKEYTVLLEPPTYKKPKSATLLANNTVTAQSNQNQQNQPSFEGDHYTVQRNDTLWNIAEKVNKGNASTYQMMMGLFDTNPQAFVRSNINNLISGSVLSIPTEKQITTVSKRAARANFNNQIKAHPIPSSSPHQSSKLEVASGTSMDMDTTDLDSADNELLKTKLIMMTEKVESSTQEATNLRNEVEDLKSQLADMQRLIDLKNQQMTKIQSQASMTDSGSETVTDEMDNNIDSNRDEIADNQMTDMMDDDTSTTDNSMIDDNMSLDDAATTIDDTTDNMSEEIADNTDDMMDTASSTADDMMDTASSTADDMMDTASSTADDMMDTASSTADDMMDTASSTADDMMDTADDITDADTSDMGTDEPDEFSGETNLAVGDSTSEEINNTPETLATVNDNMETADGEAGLLDNDFALPALGLGGLLAAGGAGWMLFGRRRKEEYDNDEESILLPIDPASSMDESLLVDSSESSLDESSFLSEFNENDIDDLQNDTSEVDLLSETDVYIAYGRYDQAEELIGQALENKPDELPLLFKQLEIYYASRKTADFDKTLAHLQSLDAENEDPNSWMRAMDMQTELSSIDTGYAGAASAGIVAAGAATAATDTLIDDVDSLMKNETSVDDVTNFNDSLDLADGTSEEIELDLGDNIELDLDTGSKDDLDLGTIETTAKDVPENDLDKTYVLDTSPIENEVEQTLTIKANQSNDDAIDDLDQSLESLDNLENSGANEFDLSLTDDVADIDLGDDDFPVSTLDELDSSLEQDLSQLSELNLDDLDLGEPEDDSVLSGIDLSDFGDEDTKTETADVNLGSEVVDDDEIETKLDLANAYAEMGDADGAKSIIEEIMDEGNTAQKAKAEAILKNLS